MNSNTTFKKLKRYIKGKFRLKIFNSDYLMWILKGYKGFKIANKVL